MPTNTTPAGITPPTISPPTSTPGAGVNRPVGYNPNANYFKIQNSFTPQPANPLNGFAILNSLGSAVGGVLKTAVNNVANLGAATVYADNRPAALTKELQIYKTLQGIGYNETRGVKTDRYTFSKPSGKPELGNDLGYYQVTEGELRSYGQRYLGRVPTTKEFLSTPKLQDLYMSRKVDYYRALGYSPQQIADIHRSGFTNAGEPGSTTYQNPQYVKSFEDFYLKQ